MGLYDKAATVGWQRRRGRIRSCWGGKFYRVCSDGVWGVRTSVMPTTKFVDLTIWAMARPFTKVRSVGEASLVGKQAPIRHIFLCTYYPSWTKKTAFSP